VLHEKKHVTFYQRNVKKPYKTLTAVNDKCCFNEMKLFHYLPPALAHKNFLIFFPCCIFRFRMTFRISTEYVLKMLQNNGRGNADTICFHRDTH